MITGDNPLTACHVAKELRFTSRGAILILTLSATNEWIWESIDQTLQIPLEKSLVDKNFIKTYDLCVTGEVSSLGKKVEKGPHFVFVLIPSLHFSRVWLICLIIIKSFGMPFYPTFKFLLESHQNKKKWLLLV